MKFKILLTLAVSFTFATEIIKADLREFFCNVSWSGRNPIDEARRTGRLADLSNCLNLNDNACAEPIKEKACLNAKEGEVCAILMNTPAPNLSYCKKNTANKLSCEIANTSEYECACQKQGDSCRLWTDRGVDPNVHHCTPVNGILTCQ